MPCLHIDDYAFIITRHYFIATLTLWYAAIAAITLRHWHTPRHYIYFSQIIFCRLRHYVSFILIILLIFIDIDTSTFDASLFSAIYMPHWLSFSSLITFYWLLRRHDASFSWHYISLSCFIYAYALLLRRFFVILRFRCHDITPLRHYHYITVDAIISRCRQLSYTPMPFDTLPDYYIIAMPLLFLHCHYAERHYFDIAIIDVICRWLFHIILRHYFITRFLTFLAMRPCFHDASIRAAAFTLFSLRFSYAYACHYAFFHYAIDYYAMPLFSAIFCRLRHWLLITTPLSMTLRRHYYVIFTAVIFSLLIAIAYYAVRHYLLRY